MPRHIPQSTIDDLLDELAAIEHERWSHWQRYLHGKCARKSDGSLMIPAELVSQWERQLATSYDDLSEAEKNSDRDQVRRYLPTILHRLGIVVDKR